jgi:hypothetical protein
MASSFKLTGISWREGYAAKHAMLNPAVSIISEYVHLIPDVFLYSGSFMVLIYQFTFPVTIIYKNLIKYYFSFGVLFHFIVLLTFGLKTFFIAMLLTLASLLYPYVKDDNPTTVK